jgi:hypothetical protein
LTYLKFWPRKKQRLCLPSIAPILNSTATYDPLVNHSIAYGPFARKFVGVSPKEELPMNLLSKLFGGGNKYNDAQIVSQATTAITNDPMISDPSALVVTSKNGVITVSGIVYKAQEKDRIEGVIRSALTTMGLKHERIINELKLPHSAG